MESHLRTALVDWLASDPALSTALNDVAEESPSRASEPWLGIAASSSRDWSTKDLNGREIRVALELHARGETAHEAASLVSLIENRVETIPRVQDGFRIVTTVFLRARAERRAGNTRAVLLEYRFHLLEA